MFKEKLAEIIEKQAETVNSLIQKELKFQNECLGVKQKIIAEGPDTLGHALLVNFPVENKLIILIDIVGFSKQDTRDQVSNIYLFQRYLISEVLNNKMDFANRIHISNFIPTGDGCYIVADECDAKTAMDFLVSLTGGFQHIGSGKKDFLSLRVSATIGECVPFIDMGHHKNFIGKGMNEAARILSCGQAVLENDFKEKNPYAETMAAKVASRNSLYIDDSLSVLANEYKDECAAIKKFENVADKHGFVRNITVLQNIN